MVNSQTKPSYRPAFAIDSLLNFGTQLSIFALAFVSTLIIARALGPHGKGLYSFVILIPTLLANCLNMGINFSNVYFIGQKEHSVNCIVGNTISFSLLLGLSITLIFFVMITFPQLHFFANIQTRYLYITFPILPFILVLDSINSTLLGNRKIAKLSAVRLVKSSTYLTCLLLTFYLSTTSVYNVIFAYIAGILAAIIIGSYFLITSRYFTGFVFNKLLIKQMLKFGLKQHLGSVCQILNYRIDMLIEKVHDSIGLLREYRTALIAAAVTGKIDVRGNLPNGECDRYMQ